METDSNTLSSERLRIIAIIWRSITYKSEDVITYIINKIGIHHTMQFIT